MTTRTRFVLATTALVLAPMLLPADTALAKTQAPPTVYGPAPDWGEYRRLAEAAITARLLDPESARYTWLSGYAQAYMRPELFQPRVAGYWACGKVNARNRMGGYSGGGTFLVVIDHGHVLATSLDQDITGANSLGCQSMLDRGILPPVPEGTPAGVASTTMAAGAMPSGPAPAPSATTIAAPVATPPAATASGLTLRAMPEGAYVTQVAPGSIAAAAGLKPGMVIASVNAVPLANMGDAMTKVVDAAGTSASLGLIGGMKMKLGEHR